MVKMMSSLLVMQFALHGISRRIYWSIFNFYTVIDWTLSLQLDIWADCMERLSTDKGDLRILVDEMVSQLHYPPFPNKKVVNKSVDDNIDTFWKEFKHFTELAHTAIVPVPLKMMMPF